MKKSLLALAFGTFGLGISEFVMMGILPYLASDFNVSISQAGTLISAYALGVCFGAPLVAVFARKWPLKRILYLLLGIFSAAALAISLCPTPNGDTHWQFALMLALRFIAGTPHGAFFGVSAIVADKLSDKGNAAFSVAVACSGMSVANLIGNPLCTFVTLQLSWRYIFAFNAIWGAFTLFCASRWMPDMDALPDHGLKAEFRFLKTPAPWIIFACTVLGNAGIFCWYSYISPTMTQLAGIPETMMSLMIVLAGAGMFVGNLSGGRLADRFKPGHTGLGIEMVMCIALTATAFSAHIPWCAIPLMILCTACLFAVSLPQQLLMVRFSKGGELLGGAMVQIGFNLGNAIGAWAGGLAINEADPFTYHYPAAVGAVLCASGVAAYFIFCHKYEKRRIIS
ncbi:MAG: MFS transporter [Bacteroidia bacterium]|nr:MFS transporter [Bacteroidia bacterium]